MSIATGIATTVGPQFSVPRACGAVALVEVLKHWGVDTDLRATWNCISWDDPFGTRCARSYLMARCAISHELDAITLKCRKERAWEALIRCSRLGLSVIINHQSRASRVEGHYSILKSISDSAIITRDPTLNCQEEWLRDEFLTHWDANAEITGNVLVAMGKDTEHSEKSLSSACPICRTSLRLRPTDLFTPADWDVEGLWQNFYCHGCDASFSLQS